jgi:hypothetical protein
VQEICSILASVLIAIAAAPANAPVKTESAATNSYAVAPSALIQQEQAKEIWMGDILFNEDTLSYNGYVVEMRNRKVKNDYPVKTRIRWIDVSYAVLKRKGKVLIEFDANIYFGMGNSTRFGLFSFLPSKAKQLVVSQDIFRGGTQWVIELSPRPRIVFDGPKWEVGREGDDMKIMDLDGDGLYEISVPLCDFYGFAKLSPAATPLPEIIFKYSKQARRYLPANPQFADHLLAEIGNQKQNLPQPDAEVEKMDHLGGVLSIVLDYVFAGREQEAWTFYDQAYKLPDKDRFKTLVRARLSHSPVYRFIYHKNARKR